MDDRTWGRSGAVVCGGKNRVVECVGGCVISDSLDWTMMGRKLAKTFHNKTRHLPRDGGMDEWEYRPIRRREQFFLIPISRFCGRFGAMCQASSVVEWEPLLEVTHDQEDSWGKSDSKTLRCFENGWLWEKSIKKRWPITWVKRKRWVNERMMICWSEGILEENNRAHSSFRREPVAFSRGLLRRLAA